MKGDSADVPNKTCPARITSSNYRKSAAVITIFKKNSNSF